MSPTETSLLLLIAWPLLLVMCLGLFRLSIVFSGKKDVAGFSPSGDDVAGFGQRLTRAHANCYEAIPFAIGLMLYAIITQKTGITDPLAFAFLSARIGQSIVHIASGARLAIGLRFLFFVAQVLIMLYWVYSFLTAS